MTEQATPFDEVQKPPLNEGQQWAHDRTVQYVTGEGENLPNIVLVKGPAGTGKTFTINRIVETLKTWSDKQKEYFKKLQIAASAPTHKAVRVMRKNADLGSNVTYATIHSLLGLKPDVDYKTGARIFVPSKDPEDGRIKEFNVLIIDEVSMLGKDLWEPILQAIADDQLKVILLGDGVQIPPVNELDSPPLLEPEKYGVEVLELNQSMRQIGDHPILDYATDIRNSYKNQVISPVHKVNEIGHGITLLSSMDVKQVDQILEDKFCSPEFKADADYMKVIAWRNEVVDQFNKRIRNMMYAIPEGMLALPLLVNGEKLILDERYSLPGTNGQSLPTNEELEVVSYEIVKKAIAYKLWTPMGYANKTLNPQVYWTKVRFRNVKGHWVTVDITIVHESSKREVDAMLAEITKSAKATTYGTPDRSEMWKHFYFIKGQFAQVKYNYAVTAHKSQGSTYNNCMIIQWDIALNRKLEERNRITYVGATRARNMLYIVQ